MVVKTTIFSIFGISIFDNFGIDFISNLLNEIRVITSSIIIYLSETQFYSFVASLFSKKESVTKEKISIRENQWFEKIQGLNRKIEKINRKLEIELDKIKDILKSQND